MIAFALLGSTAALAEGDKDEIRIGQITDAPPVAELVGRMKTEFDQARQDFLMRASA